MKKAIALKELAQQALYLETHILITDNKYIHIENCKKVLEYNDVYIKLITTTKLIIQVWGNDIKLDEYNREGIIIRGNITSIEFMKNGGK